ncbi:MAG: hypothetical protein FWC16_10580 [Defluviitaleaceae bacterium]|nr:hypothetical protein [Defluviitaleaceae bacterium]MCL2275362.1 hypothetical protein [Defluviitaleaceae bacterium]
MKKILALLTLALLALVLTACGAEETPREGVFDLEEVMENPQAFLGDISIAGVAGVSVGNEFMLLTNDGTIGINVDFRGNQAMPEAGIRIVVIGNLRAQRPCCGDGHYIVSFLYAHEPFAGDPQ